MFLMSIGCVTNVCVGFLKKWFGDFTKEEFKKYFLLGLTFAVIIGVYWTLRPLKDAIFGSVVGGGSYLAMAKIVSLILLFPVVAIYGKLLHRFPRHRMLYFMLALYAVLMVFWGIVFALPGIGLSNTVTSAWRFSGWLWYVFVESFGSLVVALFWAFTADISDHKSAKYGFPLIVLIGQIGGIIAPKYLTKLPQLWGTTNAPLVCLMSVFIVLCIVLVALFMHVMPKEELKGFNSDHKDEPEEPGFLDGLKLLVSHKYLLGMFAIVFFFEVITTFLDFNFKIRVLELLSSDTARSAYLGDFASTVNLVSFLCILFGINNIQRWLGLRTALALIPVCIGGAVVMLRFYDDINVLMWLVVGAKAIGYALNSPTMKQLYIPTSNDAKYKSQAWIEAFGSRGAKASSSGFNALRGILGAEAYIAILFYFSLGILAAWFYIALYLSKQYNTAIKENRTVC